MARANPEHKAATQPATTTAKRARAAESSSRKSRKRRPGRLGSPSFDWATFTNFQSRYTRQDLEQLFNETRANRRKEILERPDGVGLYPIHWAAINNRPDLIEVLFARGSSLTKKCRNSLFADGTPLHLAAMNSSLEAAATLLSKSQELDKHRTRPKSLPKEATETSDSEKPAKKEASSREDNNAEDEDTRLTEMMEARDSEGQTPLMRSAAPRSRRWNTFRELLQKNFWSLSGRPAEMALFLICLGADWRATEPQNGMNLMHLAIMHDYDDIVSLLLVIDKQLVGVATLRASQEDRKQQAKQQAAARDGFQTIELDSASNGATTDNDSSEMSASRKPLIDSKSETANDLLARGIKPLQLAILYGRVKMISLLWRPRRSNPETDDDSKKKSQEQEEDESSKNDQELKRLLIKACFSDSDELAKFLKPLVLKGLLLIDLVLIALVWAPVYCSSAYFNKDFDENQQHHYQQHDSQHHNSNHSQSLLPGLRGGLFFVSYCISLALTLRVMLKNPGFLRRHSVHYLSELANLLDGAPRAREAIANRLGRPKADPKEDLKQKSKESDRQPGSPLIKLDDTTGIVVGGRSKQVVEKEPKQTDENKVTMLAMDKPDDGSAMPEQRIRRLKHGVRQLCHRCQCIRRPRSRHCTFCDHCVQDFDHHCIYLGCCIGRNNRLDFLLAMIALSITSIYGTILQSISMGHLGLSRFWHLVAFIFIFKYVVIGAVTAFVNLRRACQGVTLYEQVRSARLRQMFGRHGPPEEISKTHATLSILEGASFWRYLPYDQSMFNVKAAGVGSRRGIMSNLREFANYISPDEYLLTFICTDTPLARSLLTRPSDLRIKQQQMQKLV